MTYILISPRGFANETYLARGSAARVRMAAEIINDDINAWADIVPASSPEVRRAKREAARWGETIAELDEGDVRRHRPVYLHNDGRRSLGMPRLPA